ncbi:SDR family NAD(P)-dependent oxidoreductase [Phaeovulum sp.]|uniref:SDR family NAD(P)-dependent oxidoreductase n=1 Tax=Phaeovulum sp. TaxID=2934796 RepID=UPI002731ACFD|nr:SDR family NAD(P)-dependent oxidoreductase [Phaeovulum sp.]MDP1670325.1 SDR family NAD(P)-dependent oxidoreductase [Phaeovulum sp.]MDZ4120654.1 SDR family NAD(P)-dependent oxidoreductase [Phaeovulum sp.]
MSAKPDTATAPPRTALVTGASRGLGAALAEALAAQGWHVIAVARTVGGLEELDDRIQAAGGNTTLAPMDVTDADAMAHLAASITARWGGLQLWAHTAIHAESLTPAGHVAAKDLAKSVACNLAATAHLIGLVEPLLRAGHGTAVFFDDPRGGQKFFGAYGATKSAQIALARSWQAESAKIGPRVLIEAPLPMPTATRARFFPGEDRSALTPTRTEAARILTRL